MDADAADADAARVYASMVARLFGNRTTEYGELTFFGDLRYSEQGRAMRALLQRAADTVFRRALRVPGVRILAPVPGTIIALDPDIPPDRQRLQFVASGGRDLRWRIDGREQGRGARWAWPPWPGRHQLELVDARGKVHDTLQFEVRGAGVLSRK